jgi:hypothetical protein
MPEIRIDTSSLSATTFRVEGLDAATFDGNNGVTVSLPAGEYQFQQLIGLNATFPFTVSDNGTINFDPKYAGYLAGDGTATLTLTGFAITIDGRAVPHDLDTHGWYRDAAGATARFPNMIVAAAPVLSAQPGQLPVPDQDPAHWQTPLFVIPVDEQTAAYAFKIPADALRAAPTPETPGWFVVFQEHSSRMRFGFDARDPNNPPPPFDSWQDLDWELVLAKDPRRSFAVAGSDLGPPANPADMRWNRDAADIARIALQHPFRMLIHSSELVGS